MCSVESRMQKFKVDSVKLEKGNEVQSVGELETLELKLKGVSHHEHEEESSGFIFQKCR